ncbi:DUF2190 family protein [Tsukamurella sputi]|uniref:DUF2190 family protein n=1 Tax=Tsukamurella sputi TaxID=2591848 RepID=A0A5C5RVD0_9ACTN|nr:DUF2190 family protein [Tsukamurella sputi]TWS26622.1 DUF2190 family protein [Tsukamurella sputi]
MPSTTLYQPYVYDDGDEITCRATADITLGHLVGVSGPRNGNIAVAHATPGGRTLGVAGSDAKTGDLVVAYSGGVLRVIAGGAITAGDDVEVGAGGTVVKATTGKVIGFAVSSTTSGKFAEIKPLA